jgi:DnaJ-class molecular chaperone
MGTRMWPCTFVLPCALPATRRVAPRCRVVSGGSGGSSGSGGNGGADTARAMRRGRRPGGDEQRELRAAADEGLAAARAAASQDGAVAAAAREAAELEERKATKRAALEAAEGALTGRCSTCGGTGVEWTCLHCGAEGFIYRTQDKIWRTCEQCEGRGSMPCPVCAPEDPDEIIHRPPMA